MKGKKKGKKKGTKGEAEEDDAGKLAPKQTVAEKKAEQLEIDQDHSKKMGLKMIGQLGKQAAQAIDTSEKIKGKTRAAGIATNLRNNIAAADNISKTLRKECAGTIEPAKVKSLVQKAAKIFEENQALMKEAKPHA